MWGNVLNIIYTWCSAQYMYLNMCNKHSRIQGWKVRGNNHMISDRQSGQLEEWLVLNHLTEVHDQPVSSSVIQDHIPYTSNPHESDFCKSYMAWREAICQRHVKS